MTRLALAPLTCRSLAPDEFVGAARRAGFDMVGLRLLPARPGDEVVRAGSAAARRLEGSLHDDDIAVLDIEVAMLRPQTRIQDWTAGLEFGGSLGARFLTVAATDADQHRVTDRVAELVDVCAPLGILPLVEPVAYLALSDYDTAIRVATASGAGVMLDVLHYLRADGRLSMIADDPALFPLLQLSDAPRSVPPGTGSSVERQGEESREGRLPPGSGEAPLGDIIRLLSPTTAVSVEAPNARLQAESGADAFLAMLRGAARTVLSDATSITDRSTKE